MCKLVCGHRSRYLLVVTSSDFFFFARRVVSILTRDDALHKKRRERTIVPGTRELRPGGLMSATDPCLLAMGDRSR